MNDEDLLKIVTQEPYKMSQQDFVNKTKELLEKIYGAYSQEWKGRVLKDNDYPEESVCDKCTGCGIFTENGQEKDCIQDKEQGDCFHRFCDYEQVGMNLETYIGDIISLLSVDEIE